MAQKNLIKKSMPHEIEQVILQLGNRIKIARKRRGLTMKEMSSRLFVSRKTLSRLEKGDSGVSIAVFTSALWVLGLHKELEQIALPEKDDVGIFYERKRLPKRVRTPQKKDELDF